MNDTKQERQLGHEQPASHGLPLNGGQSADIGVTVRHWRYCQTLAILIASPAAGVTTCLLQIQYSLNIAAQLVTLSEDRHFVRGSLACEPSGSAVAPG